MKKFLNAEQPSLVIETGAAILTFTLVKAK